MQERLQNHLARSEDDWAKPRDGIYIGESNRTIAERTNEHYNDAESFAKKSHIIKHWIKLHPELNTAPPLKVRKLRQYKEYLSRQVGEAIAILLSRDNLLNSKNEYIQNWISRITVEKDKIARKRRLQKEEEADKEEERAVQEFNEMKRPNKWKEDNVPKGWQNAKRIRMTPRTKKQGMDQIVKFVRSHQYPPMMGVRQPQSSSPWRKKMTRRFLKAENLIKSTLTQSNLTWSLGTRHPMDQPHSWLPQEYAVTWKVLKAGQLMITFQVDGDYLYWEPRWRKKASRSLSI
jgi:hypothetical protein